MVISGDTDAHAGIDWTFALDDSLVQYLAKDETVTATYTISVKDNSGDSATDTSTQTVTVTITGTNDRPVITAIDVDGHVIEDVGAHTIDSGSTVYLTDSGAISFTDADTDDVSTATVALTGTLSTTGPASRRRFERADDRDGAHGSHARPCRRGRLDLRGRRQPGAISCRGRDRYGDLHDRRQGQFRRQRNRHLDPDRHRHHHGHQRPACDHGGRRRRPCHRGRRRPHHRQRQHGLPDRQRRDQLHRCRHRRCLRRNGGADRHAEHHRAGNPDGAVGRAGDRDDACRATYAHAGEVDWTFAVDDSLVQYLAKDETVTATYTISVKDDPGDSATDTSTQTVTVTITGANDPPAIQQGPEMAGVTEDAANTTVTGQFTAIDPDQDATQAWQVLSGNGLTAGTVTHNADLSFALDSLNIVKNSTNVFSDDFTSAPANGDGRYSVRTNSIPGTLTVDTDANNRSVLVLDAAHGVSTDGIGLTAPYLVNSAIALTGTNPAGSSTLTKTDDFTVQARFDLTVPNDLNEAYGIRLTDRLPGVAVGGTTGDNVVELRVAENTAGGIQVQFRDINFQTGPLDSNDNPLGTVTTLQNIGLSIGAIQSGEQIVLTLSHDASNPNTIIASYDLYAANGTQLDANGAAAGLTQTFTVTGSLFSDENWTQAQIHASSPAVDNSYYTGTYGTLTVDPPERGPTRCSMDRPRFRRLRPVRWSRTISKSRSRTIRARPALRPSPSTSPAPTTRRLSRATSPSL